MAGSIYTTNTQGGRGDQTKGSTFEGHDENSARPALGKGTFYPIGTAAPLREEPAHGTDKKNPVLPYPNA